MLHSHKELEFPARKSEKLKLVFFLFFCVAASGTCAVITGIHGQQNLSGSWCDWFSSAHAGLTLSRFRHVQMLSTPHMRSEVHVCRLATTTGRGAFTSSYTVIMWETPPPKLLGDFEQKWSRTIRTIKTFLWHKFTKKQYSLSIIHLVIFNIFSPPVDKIKHIHVFYPFKMQLGYQLEYN